MTLEATADRILTAQRAQSGTWTFGPEGTIEMGTNPVLAEMNAAGLIIPRFVSAHQQVSGLSDYYGLTETGERWLVAAKQASSEISGS